MRVTKQDGNVVRFIDQCFDIEKEVRVCRIHVFILYMIFIVCTEIFSIIFRITKPLTFADCVGDELPLGWEEVYDQQVGVYYIDHINSEYINLAFVPLKHK